jgi:hypothetical protein
MTNRTVNNAVLLISQKQHLTSQNIRANILRIKLLSYQEIMLSLQKITLGRN